MRIIFINNKNVWRWNLMKKVLILLAAMTMVILTACSANNNENTDEKSEVNL